MTGLEVSRISSEQKTTVSGKQQPKQESIIIKFADLPANMRTKQVREFYDKDGSGFLESKNANGQNEVALMQKAFGLELSKYKSNLTSVDKHDNGVQRGYVNNETKYWIDEKDDRIYVTDRNKKYESLVYDKNYNLYAEGTFKGENLKGKRYLKDGSTIQIEGNKATLFNKNNEVIALEVDNGDGSYQLSVVQQRKLTNGKNELISETTYTDKHKKYDGLHGEYPLSDYFENPNKTTNIKVDKNFQKTKEVYKLNGRPVQAKPIGKGRYEVTDDKGNVFYISHDGVNLKPEYVRNNP